jgi:transcriptional antiterminator NusG
MDEVLAQEQPQQDNRGSWYVIQTLTSNENKVRDSILRQIRLGDEIPVYEAFVPTEKVSEYRHDRKVDITRKVYPGYVFVRMDLYNEFGEVDEKVWYFIRGIQGVLGFPGGGNRPAALSPMEVADLKRMINPVEVTREKCIYEVGDNVHIKEGPFEGLEGQVQEVDQERGRLTVSVHVFGNWTPVELGFWQVEPLS